MGRSKNGVGLLEGKKRREKEEKRRRKRRRIKRREKRIIRREKRIIRRDRKDNGLNLEGFRVGVHPRVSRV